MKLAILLSTICLLTACSTVWYKPGATQQDFNIDKQECLAESYRDAPPSTVAIQVTSGQNQPKYTNCTSGYGNINCTTTGGGYTPPSNVYVDQNAKARDAIFVSCMYKNGWSTQKPNTDDDVESNRKQSVDSFPLNWKGDVYLGMLGSLGPTFELRFDDGRITSAIHRCKDPIMLDARRQGQSYLGELAFTPSCVAEITNNPNTKNCSYKFKVKFDYVTPKQINGAVLLPVDAQGVLIRQFINLDSCETVLEGSQHVKWIWVSMYFKQ